MKNVIICTTMWDKVSEGEGIKREEELKEIFWKEMVEHGARTTRSDGKADGARLIVKSFLKLDKIVVKIQHELVDEGKELKDTAAGIEINRDLHEREESHKKDLAETLEALQNEKDEEIREMLEQERVQQEARLAQVKRDIERLDDPQCRRATFIRQFREMSTPKSANEFMAAAGLALGFLSMIYDAARDLASRKRG